MAAACLTSSVQRNVPGYTSVYEAGDFGKEGVGTLAVARPEPLFDWFIPSDGNRGHLGTSRQNGHPVCGLTGG